MKLTALDSAFNRSGAKARIQQLSAGHHAMLTLGEGDQLSLPRRKPASPFLRSTCRWFAAHMGA